MLVRHQRSVHEQKKGKKPRSNSSEDAGSSSKKSKPSISLPAPAARPSAASDPSTPALFMQPFSAHPSPDYGLAFGGYSSWRQTTQSSSEEVSPSSEKSWSSNMLGSGMPISSNVYWANGQPTAVPILPSSSTAMQAYAQTNADVGYHANMAWHTGNQNTGLANNTAYTSSSSIEPFGVPTTLIQGHSGDISSVHAPHISQLVSHQPSHQPETADFASLSSSASGAAVVGGATYLETMMGAFPSLMASQNSPLDNVANGTSTALTAGTPTVPSQLINTTQAWWMPTSGPGVTAYSVHTEHMQIPALQYETGSLVPHNASASTTMHPDQQSSSAQMQAPDVDHSPVSHAFVQVAENELVLCSSSNKSSSESTLTGPAELPVVEGSISEERPPSQTQTLSDVEVLNDNEQKTLAAQQLCAASTALNVDIAEPHIKVTEITRMRILEFLATLPNLAYSPYFSCSNLSKYLDLFFEKWNTIIPMLHRPSFRAAEVCPALLAACIVMGTYFSDLTQVSELGRTMASKLWPAIVSLDNFDPQSITLEIMQAMVLLDAYGTFCASRRLHEMTDCFHPLIVTFARRNALFDSGPRPDVGQSTNADTNALWAQWIAHEEKVRLAHTIYMLDVLGSMLFRHQSSLNAVQPNLAFPAVSTEWEQPSAAAWLAFRAETTEHDGVVEQLTQTSTAVSTSQQSFESALKQCFIRDLTSDGLQTGSSSTDQDLFAETTLIVGLAGLSQDLIRSTGHMWTLRDHRGQELAQKQLKILSAMEACGADTLECAVPENERNSSRSVAAILKAVARLTVYADIFSIQVVCGVNPMLGQYVGAQLLSTCTASIRSWASASESITATLIALHILSHLLSDDETTASLTRDMPDQTIFKKWVIYICCTVLFAFASFREDLKSSTAADPAIQDDDQNGGSSVYQFLAATRTWTETSFDAAAVQKHMKAQRKAH
ncbi:hypothetical protein OC861_005235 [Tilletia horrida]|nr:hypothetical protein OC861_005235 [Tilletia horrida]